MEDLLCKDLWIVILLFLSPLDRYLLVTNYLASLRPLLFVPNTSYRVRRDVLLFRCNALFPLPTSISRTLLSIEQRNFGNRIGLPSSWPGIHIDVAVYLPPNIIIFRKLKGSWTLAFANKKIYLPYSSQRILIDNLEIGDSRSIFYQLIDSQSIYQIYGRLDPVVKNPPQK